MKQFLIMLITAFIVTACGNGNEKKTDAPHASSEISGNSSVKTLVANDDPNSVYVYYFHGKQRCKTCIAVQDVAQEAVKEMYGDNQIYILWKLRPMKQATKNL